MPRAPKTYSPRASTSDSCETLLTPRIWLLLGGFRSYQMCWFGCVRVLAAKLAGNRNGYAAIGSSAGSVSM